MNNENMQKNTKRGTFLTTMIVVYVALYLFRLLSIINPTASSQVYEGGSSWVYQYNVLAFVVGVVGLAGIVLWHRWGFYILGAITILSILVDFLAFAESPTFLQVLVTLAIFGLLIWSSKNKWKNFT